MNNIKGTIRACKELNVPIIHRTFDVVHELMNEKYLSKIVYKTFIKNKFNKVFLEKVLIAIYL